MSAPAPTESPTVFPGYAVPDGSYTAKPARHTSRTRLFVILGVGLAVVTGAVVAISSWLTPPSARYVCPPNCGPPPMGAPVQRNPRFTPDSGEFSVSYPGEGTAYKATMNPNGVILDLVAGDGGTLRLFSEPADNRTPRDVAKALVKKTYPDATTAYEIPNAILGYQPGYGEVDDVYPQGSTSGYTRLRVLIQVSVKDGLALVAAAVGPYHKFSPDFGTGRPSGVNLQIALDMGKYVNSFTWRGDPLR